MLQPDLFNDVRDSATAWKNIGADDIQLIKAATLKAWTGGHYASISANNIFNCANSSPQAPQNLLTILKNAESVLGRKREAPASAQPHLLNTGYFVDNFPDLFCTRPPTNDQSEDISDLKNDHTQLTFREMAHYAMALEVLCKSSLEPFRDAKVDYFVGSYLTPVRGFLQADRSTPMNFLSKKAWPFPLIAELNNKPYKTIPRSDFQIRIDGFPHCIVQVNSVEFQTDRKQMVIQGGTLVRIAEALVPGDEDSGFVLMALYVDEDLRVHRYLFAKTRESENVYYVLRSFDLKTPNESLQFLVELYNFRTVIGSNNQALGPNASNIEPLQRLIKAAHLPSLAFSIPQPSSPSNSTSSESKRKRRTSSGSDSDGRSRKRQARSSLVETPEIKKVLAHRGYTLEESVFIDDHGDEWISLEPSWPTVCKASHASDGDVVVKLVKPSSLEVRIHKHLVGIKHQHNHTIPIISTIDVSSGTLLITPRGVSLTSLASKPEFKPLASSLARQLLSGVGFMHANGVAHLDLKPDNLVVMFGQGQGRDDPHLHIIDFGIAYIIPGPSREAVLRGFRGTDDWVAPEVGEKDGPDSEEATFNPIAADLWATGRIIEKCFSPYLSGVDHDDSWILALATELMNPDPALRPPLDSYSDNGVR